MPDGQQYFLGVPIITEEQINAARESQDESVYMVIRIVDDPTAGSADLKRRRLRTPCEGCREICWLDPKSFDPLRGMNLTLLCMQCVDAKAKQEESDG